MDAGAIQKTTLNSVANEVYSERDFPQRASGAHIGCTLHVAIGSALGRLDCQACGDLRAICQNFQATRSFACNRRNTNQLKLVGVFLPGSSKYLRPAHIFLPHDGNSPPFIVWHKNSFEMDVWQNGNAHLAGGPRPVWLPLVCRHGRFPGISIWPHACVHALVSGLVAFLSAPPLILRSCMVLPRRCPRHDGIPLSERRPCGHLSRGSGLSGRSRTIG